MNSITTTKELNAAILLLENKRTIELAEVKEHYKTTYESLRPINFIRNTVKELITAPDFKDDLLNTSLSLAAGYFSKKIAIGSTNNPFKQVLGNFLQMGVTSVISNNADGIRTKIMNIVSTVLQKKPK